MIDRRLPKSSVIEKRPIQSSELESQISQLQEDLKKMKEQLKSCDSSNSQVQQEADEVKKQLTAKSAKIEELQLQLLEFSTAEDNRLEMLSKISQEHNSVWQSELEALQKQHLLDSTILLSAMNEIQWMKQQLDVMKSETGQSEDSKMIKPEVYTLKEEMAGTLSNIENLKIKNGERGLAEEATKFILSETQNHLKIANTTIQSLHADGYNFLKSLNSVTSKLEESKIRVSVLEELLTEYQIVAEDNEADRRNPPCKVECGALQLELEQLGVALKAAEAKHREEQSRTAIQIQSAYETVEHVKFNARMRESELNSIIEKSKVELSELNERLLDMEKEVQNISKRNKELREELSKGEAKQFDSELKLMKAATDVQELNANLLDKETVLQRILEQNEILISELNKRDSEHQNIYSAAIADAEKARAAKKEALIRIGLIEDEAEKSSKRAVKILEQLEESRAVNLELETKLKRLNVQSDQWRKAAEAASAILTYENDGRNIEDSNKNFISGKLTDLLFFDDLDDESLKKNNSLLRKIGELWKKSPI
ncbi:Interactor of constitutive active ROPs 2, chloroplastic [Dendrobium catenatum]|uniref:Interactor of constitutive active ROPs 2, chloroplastic n=1 Tax=Dendrobium catenatum TaxID=906689 RepID=A0A2I0VH87_9ASPA|nr:Interactor of constitutive active ROPs 2, chloroplastic [Dendrobium catenatum]